METSIVLVVALLGLRALGAFGTGRFASWPVSAAHALAVMLFMTAGAHFVPESVTVMPTHADLVRMVPPFVPFDGGEASPLWLRVPEQVLYIAVASCGSCPPTRSDPHPLPGRPPGPAAGEA